MLIGSSRLTPSNAGDAAWSTTPINASSQSSPCRREYATQPPPLTTALGGHQFQGLGVVPSAGYATTPLSTTSLSSPFTHQSPRAPSPGSAVGSPMASSRQASYNVRYNPRDWGPVSGVQSTYPQANNTLLRIVHPPQPGPHSGLCCLFFWPASMVIPSIGMLYPSHDLTRLYRYFAITSATSVLTPKSAAIEGLDRSQCFDRQFSFPKRDAPVRRCTRY